MGPVPGDPAAGPQGALPGAARGYCGPTQPDLELMIPYGTAGAMTAGRVFGRL